jgi:murein DD-endopeptidase MepM/ murein hydrolase activator NlpD
MGLLAASIILNPGWQPANAISPMRQTDAPPFGLPFNTGPSYSTWLVTQFYGNTTGAYNRRVEWYGAGQGLHFGIDFSAKCGTEVVAIGDGVIAKIDAVEHGAGPHNLMVNHPDQGYASFYGHLLERPPGYVGMPVQRGQVIALTGDPDVTCTSRPHLHLEIRSLGYGYAYNPVPLIDADWDSMALLNPTRFQRDLDNPRRWVSPYDQPDVQFGQPLLNQYHETWPPDWSR